MALVAAIGQDEKGYELTISDGLYVKSARVPSGGHTQGAQQALHDLIYYGKIAVGQKLHMINQSLTGDESRALLLNFNGIYPARFNARLGLQKQQIIMRNLLAIK